MSRDDLLDKAAALRDAKLEPYQGHDVLRTSIAIRNAGDGLSAAMKIDPALLPLSETQYVLIETKVAGHDYVPIEDTDALELKQILRAGAAVLVSAELAKPLIDAQREAIQKAKDEAQGRVNLEGEPGWLHDSNGEGDEDDETTVLRRNHVAGNHADAVYEGCPLCADAASE